MMKLLFLILIILTSTPGFSQTFYCPSSQQYISVGQTMAQVRLACGEPLSSESHQLPTQTQLELEKWVYGTKTVNNRINPTIIFWFQQGKVSKIDTRIVAQTSSCSQLLKIGDDQDTVKMKCGIPVLTSKSQEQQAGPPQEIILWKYKINPYSPATVVEFENDKVTKISTESH